MICWWYDKKIEIKKIEVLKNKKFTYSIIHFIWLKINYKFNLFKYIGSKINYKKCI